MLRERPSDEGKQKVRVEGSIILDQLSGIAVIRTTRPMIPAKRIEIWKWDRSFFDEPAGRGDTAIQQANCVMGIELIR